MCYCADCEDGRTKTRPTDLRDNSKTLSEKVISKNLRQVKTSVNRVLLDHMMSASRRAHLQWDQESVDSGFSSDSDARIKHHPIDEKPRRLSCDDDCAAARKHDSTSATKRSNVTRSLPSHFRSSEVDSLRLGDVALTDFDPVRYLGGGGYSRVDLVRLQRNGCKRSRLFALKKISRRLFAEPKQEKQFEREKKVLDLAQSRFIPRLYRTFCSPNYVYLLTEPCLNGDLFSYVECNGPLRCGVARYIVACVTEALRYLHNELGVIHRDVKTENVLIGEQGVAKLGDLGFCTHPARSHDLTYTFCGTPGYIAPEVLLHVGHNYTADYFSLGVVTFEILTCRSPFRHHDVIDTHRATLRGITDVSFPCQLDHVTKSFIRALCYREPDRRLSDEVRSHEWFFGFDWDELRGSRMTSPLKFSTSELTPQCS